MLLVVEVGPTQLGAAPRTCHTAAEAGMVTELAAVGLELEHPAEERCKEIGT